MILKKCKYDPAVYGQLRADYLNRLSGSYARDNYAQNNEKRRHALIKEIKEGKLGKQK